jgi:PAS domain S-box-containing protein
MTEGEKQGDSLLNAHDFRRVAEMLPLAVIESTSQFKITFMNSYAMNLLGLDTRTAYKGKTLLDFLDKNYHKKLRSVLPELRELAASVVLTAPLLNHEGEQIQFQLRISPYKLKGKSGRLRIFAADTRVKLDALDRYQLNEAILSEMLNNSHDGIVIIGDEFKFEFVSDEAARIFRGEREDLLGRDFRTFMEKDAAAFVAKRYRQRRKGQAVPERYPFQILTKDGDRIEVEVRVAIANASDGSLKTIVHILDITDRRREQRALVETEARYEVLVETMNDGLAIDDRDGKLIYCNEAFAEMLGESQSSLIGKQWVDFTEDRDREWVKTKIEERRTGRTGKYELNWISKIGEIVPTIVSATPYFDPEGKFVGTFAVITEISAQKEAEETIQFYLDLLTHDIANQLQVITTASGLLDPELPRSYLLEAQGDILDAVERCNRLITKVKRAGQLRRLPTSKVNLTNILDEKVSVLSRVYGATVFVEDIEAPVYVRADALLGELIWNLLENAARHNPKEDKRVWVSGSRDGDLFKLSISDDGPGISKARKEGIFDRRQHSGGVGLTLVAQMARKYGGTVEVVDRVKGKPSHGARFILTLQEVPE